MIDQMAIAVTGPVAIWLSQDRRENWRRYACVFGMGEAMSNPTKNGFIAREFMRVFLGDLIGSGVDRYVYELRHDSSYVAKIEEASKSFHNAVEWQIWRRLEGSPLEKWLAPCLDISPCGSVLIQRRTTPITSGPERMPAFLGDMKLANFGMLNGRVVCHDYSRLRLVEPSFSIRMRKVHW